MTRWIAASLGMALCWTVLSGCERQVFLNEKDATSPVNRLSQQLEQDPQASTTPIAPLVEAPPVVDFPSRPPRYISLSEAIAIALENGTAGSNLLGPDGLNTSLDNTLFALNRGQATAQTDRIRVLALNPAIAFNSIEASESRFDVKSITNMNWTVTDQLTNGLNNFNNGETAAFNTSFVKALASGGVANVTFNANYTNLVNPPTVGTFRVINPLYNTPVNIGIEQPLLRDFGSGINQLLNQVAPIQGVTMPLQAANYYNNSRLPLTQGPNFTGLPVQGILLARLSFDQARAEFERQVHNLLLNVELSYWKLYQSYGNLYAYEEVLRLAHKAWWIGQANYQAGRLAPQDFFPIHAQYEEFRGERLKALGAVLEAERQFRGIIGLPVEDGSRLVPISEPTLARYIPHWKAAEEDALALRPELVLARENVKTAQFNLAIQKNFLRPDLRFIGQYTPVGYGTTLDGRGTLVDGTGTTRTNNVFGSLAGGNFNNWTVGLTLNVPLGYRLEHAALRSARLGLAQSYYFLMDQEERAIRTLALHYQKMDEWYRRIEIARAERQAYAKSVESQWELYKAGTSGKQQNLTALVLSLLQYNRSMALAELKEYEAISEYNGTLARFEWAKGSIMRHDNVQIAEGPLPQLVQIRAVDNERQRTKALVLNERNAPAAPVTRPGMIAADITKIPSDLMTPAPGPAPMSVNLDGSNAAKAVPGAASSTSVPAASVPANSLPTTTPAAAMPLSTVNPPPATVPAGPSAFSPKDINDPPAFPREMSPGTVNQQSPAANSLPPTSPALPPTAAPATQAPGAIPPGLGNAGAPVLPVNPSPAPTGETVAPPPPLPLGYVPGSR